MALSNKDHARNWAMIARRATAGSTDRVRLESMNNDERRDLARLGPNGGMKGVNRATKPQLVDYLLAHPNLRPDGYDCSDRPDLQPAKRPRLSAVETEDEKRAREWAMIEGALDLEEQMDREDSDEEDEEDEDEDEDEAEGLPMGDPVLQKHRQDARRSEKVMRDRVRMDEYWKRAGEREAAAQTVLTMPGILAGEVERWKVQDQRRADAWNAEDKRREAKWINMEVTQERLWAKQENERAERWKEEDAKRKAQWEEEDMKRRERWMREDAERGAGKV